MARIWQYMHCVATSKRSGYAIYYSVDATICARGWPNGGSDWLLAAEYLRQMQGAAALAESSVP
jgi:hypothetical protein